MEILTRSIDCPYCGESIELLIDDSEMNADYYEDCSVCCRPIRIKTNIDVEGDFSLIILRDDD